MHCSNWAECKCLFSTKWTIQFNFDTWIFHKCLCSTPCSHLLGPYKMSLSLLTYQDYDFTMSPPCPLSSRPVPPPVHKQHVYSWGHIGLEVTQRDTEKEGQLQKRPARTNVGKKKKNAEDSSTVGCNLTPGAHPDSRSHLFVCFNPHLIVSMLQFCFVFM